MENLNDTIILPDGAELVRDELVAHPDSGKKGLLVRYPARGEYALIIDGEAVPVPHDFGALREKATTAAYKAALDRKLYDSTRVYVPKGELDRWRQAAKDEGLKLNSMIVSAVRAYINGGL